MIELDDPPDHTGQYQDVPVMMHQAMAGGFEAVTEAMLAEHSKGNKRATRLLRKHFGTTDPEKVMAIAAGVAARNGSRMTEKLMTGDIEAVVQAIIDASKGGDMTACKIILDRICPTGRGRRTRLEPIAIEETQAALAALEHPQKDPKTLDLERRIAALEERFKPKPTE